MEYQVKIEVPITLFKHVVAIEFKSNLLVSLDCSVCRRSQRTIILFDDQRLSLCTPSKHGFPGRISRMEISDRKKMGLLSSKSQVTATYWIEYAFETFIDKKHPQTEIRPRCGWGRVSFLLTCRCGKTSEHETQNNLVRPWRAVCECNRVLYQETDETPKIAEACKI